MAKQVNKGAADAAARLIAKYGAKAVSNAMKAIQTNRRGSKKVALGPTGVGRSGYGTAGTGKRGEPFDMSYPRSNVYVRPSKTSTDPWDIGKRPGEKVVKRSERNKEIRKAQQIIKKINRKK